MASPLTVEEYAAELAKRDATIAQLTALTAAQAAKLEELEALVLRQSAELSRNSTNSNLPPSSDGPGGSVPKRRRKAKGRKRGGQKGHKGSHRALVPLEKVDEVVPMFPARCDGCHASLPKTADLRPKRHQQTELSPFAPRVTEWQRYAVTCPACGHRTRAHYDDDVIPRSAFGPRLMAVVVMLTGVYHLSRRDTARLLLELLGLRISTGSVSNIEHRMSEAVAPAASEALEVALDAPVKHTDGTTWLCLGALVSLWTLATAAVTVFKILPNGKRETLERELLERQKGVMVSDRATALKFWAMGDAERELRRFVLWRKRSHGSQSERGDRLAERLMTVAHTARKQGRDVLDFLVACARRYSGEGSEMPAPSLFAAA